MATIVLRNYLQQVDQLLEEGRFNEATRHCRHILQQYPRHIDTYRALAKAYLEQHQYSEATDLFHRVLSADPNDFISHVGLAIIHKEESRQPQAIWHMERAFEIQPYNAAIREELKGLYAAGSGQPPEQTPLTRAAVARLYAESEMYDLAAAELHQLQSQNGDHIGLDVLLAETLWYSDQRMEAVDVCLAVLDKLPQCIPANAILADIWLRTGRLEEAQTYLHRLQELLQPTQEFYLQETIAAQAFQRPGAPELPEAVPVETYDPEVSEDGDAAPVDADVAPVEEGDYAWLQDLDLGAVDTAVSERSAASSSTADSSLTARLDEETVEEEEERGAEEVAAEEDEGRIDTDWFKDEPTSVPESFAWADEEEVAAEEEEMAAAETAVEADLFADTDTSSGLEDLPDWLREDEEEAEPLQLSQDEVTDWLEEMESSDDAGGTDWFRQPEAEDEAEEEKPETDWFQDSETETELPAADEEGEALSWLDETDEAFEPVYLNADEMGGWLADEAEEESIETAAPADALEEERWEGEGEAETAAPPVESEEAETAPPVPAAEPEPDTGDLPEWLADGLSSDFGRDLEASEGDQISVSDVPDWLMTGQLDEPEEPAAAAGTPAWLADVADTAPEEETLPEPEAPPAAEAEAAHEMDAEAEPGEEWSDLDLDQLSQAPDLATGALEESAQEVDDDLPDWLRLSDTGLSDEVLEPDEPDEIDLAMDDIFGDLAPLGGMGGDAVAEADEEDASEPDDFDFELLDEAETTVAEESGELTFDTESVDLDQLSAEAEMGTDELFAQFAESDDELPDWLTASEAELGEMDLETGDLVTGDLSDFDEMGVPSWLQNEEELTAVSETEAAEDMAESPAEEKPPAAEEADEAAPVPGETAAQLDALADMMADDAEEPAPAGADTGLLDWLMSDAEEPGEMEADMMGENDERADEQRELPEETPPAEPAASETGEGEAPELPDSDSLDWLEDLAAAADADEKAEEASPEMAGLTTGPLPDWLQELSGAEGEADAAEAPEGITDFLTPAGEEETETTAAPTDMLDWLQAEASSETEPSPEAEELAAELADAWPEVVEEEGASGEDDALPDEVPAWLQELAAGAEPEAPEAPPTPEAEPSLSEEAEVEAMGDTDELFAALDEEIPAAETSDDWLSEAGWMDEIDETAAEETPEAMDWLDDLGDLEEEGETAAAAPEPEADEFEAALADMAEAPEEKEGEAFPEPVAFDDVDETEEAMAWLDEMDETAAEETPEAMDWLDDLGDLEEEGEAAAAAPEPEADEFVAALADMAEAPEEEEGETAVPAPEPDEVDEAMAWLETLEEEEEETPPQFAADADLEEMETDETLDWLADMGEAPEEAAEEEPEEAPPAAEIAPAASTAPPDSEEIVFPDEAMFPRDVGEPTDAPEELDDTMAWMEQFAAEQGVSLEVEDEASGETAVPEADVSPAESEAEQPEAAETGPPAEPQAATADEAYTAPGAEELVFPDEAMFPRDMGEPTDAPEELDDAMAWLEELAAEQGSPIEELPTVADRALPETVVADEAAEAAPAQEAEEAEAEADAPEAATPESTEPQAATAADAYTASGAEELVFPDEAMFPRGVGAPTDAPEELDDAMAWLEELAGEQGISMEAEETEPAPAEAPAPEEPPVAEEEAAPSEPAPASLAQSLAALARQARDDAPDLDALLAQAEAPPQPAPAATDLMAALDWLEQQMAAPSAAAAEPDIEELPEDPEEAMAWLEQYAEPDEVESAAEKDSPETSPAETAVAPPATEDEWIEMPEDPDEAMAWLEQMAVEEEDVAPEDAETTAAVETPPPPPVTGAEETEEEAAGDEGLPQASSAADAYTASGAEELVFPDEAMFPRDLGAPTDAPQELDDAMSWLEELAGEQGISMEDEEEIEPPEQPPPAAETPPLPLAAAEWPAVEEEETPELPDERETAVSPPPADVEDAEEIEEPDSLTADLFGDVEDTEDTLSWMADLAGEETVDTDFFGEQDESVDAITDAELAQLSPEEEAPPGSLSDMVDAVRQRNVPITDDDTPSGIFDDSFLGGPEINLEAELADSWPEWLSSDPEEQPGLGETGWLRSLSEPDVAGWLAAEDEGMASDAALDDSFSEPYLDSSFDSSFESSLDSSMSDYHADSSSLFDVGDLPAADPSVEESDEPSITVSSMELNRDKLETAREELEAGSVETAVAHYQDLVKSGQGLSILIADLEQASQRAPQKASVRRLLGDAYMRNGQLQKALETYREALDMI